MRAKEVRFFNSPTEIPLSHYEAAQDSFLERVGRFRGVAGVYRFGSVTYPGLSDLDLIVILDENAGVDAAGCNEISLLDAKARYVLYHPQFVVPHRLLPVLELLLPVFEIEQVAGRVTLRSDFRIGGTPTLRPHFVVQSIVTDFAWVLWGMPRSGRVDLRMAQAKLNLLAKNLEMAGLSSRSEVVSQFVGAVRELRSNWFGLTEAVLGSTVLQLLHSGRDCVSLLSEWIGSEPMYSSRLDGVRQGGSRSFYFHGTRSQFGESTRGSDGPVLPLLALSDLVGFANYNGPISGWINYCTGGGLPLSPALGTVQERVVAAAAHVHRLESLGFESGAFNYFGYQLGYRPGLRSFARSIVRRVR